MENVTSNLGRPVDALERSVRDRVKAMVDTMTATAEDVDVLRMWGREVDLPSEFQQALTRLLSRTGPHFREIEVPRPQTLGVAAHAAPSERHSGGSSSEANGVELVNAVLQSDPGRHWSISEIYQELLARGWDSRAKDPRNVTANLAAKAFRTTDNVEKGEGRGTYFWKVSGDEEPMRAEEPDRSDASTTMVEGSPVGAAGSLAWRDDGESPFAPADEQDM